MTIDPEFFELMPSTITVERYSGEDAYGNNTYLAPEFHRCRIDNYNLASGGGAVRSGTVITPVRVVTTIITDYTEPPFTVRDRITLPDGRSPTITSAVVEYDEVGPYHQTITCEETRE